MNFSQTEHGLIGTKTDIAALAVKDHARVLVISDSHGHPGILSGIINNYGETCDALIFCGDGIGDLVCALDIAKTDKKFAKKLPPVIAFARGNGDPGSYPLDVHTFISVPARQLLTVNGHNLLIVHGHNEGVDYSRENLGLEMQIAGSDTAFYGHTHVAAEEIEGNYKFVNAGSCARPRNGQPAGFAIVTVEKNFVDIAFIKMGVGSDGATEYSLWNPIY